MRKSFSMEDESLLMSFPIDISNLPILDKNSIEKWIQQVYPKKPNIALNALDKQLSENKYI